MSRVKSQQTSGTRHRKPMSAFSASSLEKQVERAQALIRGDSISNGLKCLSGGVAVGDTAQQQDWLSALVPQARSDNNTRPCEQAVQESKGRLFGLGTSTAEKRRKLRQYQNASGRKCIPGATLSAKSSPGPSGERASHLKDILDHASCGVRRRMRKTMDLLAEDWILGGRTQCLRFLIRAALS